MVSESRGMKRGGYIALYRSIFDDRTLDDGKFSRREAWIWLNAMAAYQPCKQTIGAAAVSVERGQIATSSRVLAKTWGWQRGSVRRFLDSLKKAKRVSFEALGVAGPAPGPPHAALGILITLCNYLEFQDSKSSKKALPARPPARETQGNLVLLRLLKPEEPNKRIDRDLAFRKAKAGSKPAKVKRADNGSIFVPTDHPQYAEFADDFKAATGFGPQPIDGGNWFWPLGEASRPSDLLHLRARRAVA